VFPVFVQNKKLNYSFFQLKATGDGVNPNPILTFGLRKSTGLDLEFSHDLDQEGEKYPMLTLDQAKGRWIQVC
jgi:hypothetical protein